ncbi:MAG TPA: asparagine synthase (glutamine-hydrolyzing) [Verrucomicrobiae bacterium]|nr:asparagine synthase (glutamine-hydrolyzing) [Verrucomicrobiae bacterium]
MCGIAGILHWKPEDQVSEEELRQMLSIIRHRGPDEFGIYLEQSLGLGSARLSIVDLKTGQQPFCNEDRTKWVVFNGEIFNYVELRPELEALGHRFVSSSDTEVLLHAYEQWGPGCMDRFNGQFAFAVWDSREHSLFLARDRLGVRPLFYAATDRGIVFGSEIKAVLAGGRFRAEIEPSVLRQIFTYWSPVSPATAFRDIRELSPGHYLLVKNREITVKPYWELSFPCENTEDSWKEPNTEENAEHLGELLVDATKLRLRADVPVGAYLSGGLDSSIITTIIKKFTSNRLDTFSIAFEDPDFDESAFQKQMARFLGTDHQVIRATHQDIGRVFPEVIWHTEVPVVRTAPAPMFLLSKLVHQAGYKVVLTGEGADEFLAGYDIFKEAKVRRFWAVCPESKWRPALLKRLYADISGLARNNPALLQAFFREGLSDVQSACYSHALRWRNGRRNCRFLTQDFVDPKEPAEWIRELLPGNFCRWAPLSQAQYLEIKLFLSQYLLSSQGDRMGMAHSIEGRFPFLDYRVTAFCNRLPPNLKLRGLTEKYLLKKLGGKWLPPEIWQRPKRPYRAPIHRCFFNQATPEYVTELLSTESLKRTGYFKPEPVEHLIQKIKKGTQVSESDDMALAGILSTQLLHHQFIDTFPKPPPFRDSDQVRVCRPVA